MRKTAANNGLFLIAVAILLLGGIQELMACSKSAASNPDDPKKIAAGPDSLTNTACVKHAKEKVETEVLTIELPEPAPVPPLPAGQKQPAKSEVTNNNMSFNFLYYLFYKFSVSEFFKTPDFSESSGY